MAIIDFQKFDLINVGYALGTISKDAYDSLMIEINEIAADFTKAKPYNKALAGQIKKEYSLTKNFNLVEDISLSMAEKYLESFEHRNVINPRLARNDWELELDDVWINYQSKYEYNPIHYHSGILSFVIWMKIPYTIDWEKMVHPGNKARNNHAGNFEMYYTDIFGKIRNQAVVIDKRNLGTICIFPSQLNHAVTPFYSSDDYRISIAGNIKIKNAD